MPDPVRSLIAQWSEFEKALWRRIAAQPNTEYAERLEANADGIRKCIDELSAALAAEPQEESASKRLREMAKHHTGVFTCCGLALLNAADALEKT